MTPQEFRKYLQRDTYCPHCGVGAPYLVPHHRKNRGMGGSKLLNNPSNILLVCAELNNAMESHSLTAADAKVYGWKLSSWDDPLVVPYYDSITGFAFRLKDDYTKEAI
jgi:hypothetical protein